MPLIQADRAAVIRRQRAAAEAGRDADGDDDMIKDRQLSEIRAVSKINLKALELAAMWLYSEEYTAQNLSVHDFYAALVDWQRDAVKRMVAEVVAATIP